MAQQRLLLGRKVTKYVSEKLSCNAEEPAEKAKLAAKPARKSLS
jgi:hypothetical protein